MSKVEVNQVTQQCGTTLTVGGGACKTAVVDATTVTLGRCGGTVSLASGATQSGFGRTGTVDWQTGDIKTGDFTAATGKGYFVNTTSGAVIVTLPLSPSVGDIVAASDYANTADTNNITFARNGSNIEGAASNLIINTEGNSTILVYADAIKGWIVVSSGNSSLAYTAPTFVTATGGTPCAGATCGDYKYHTFTGPGTFCVSAVGNPAGSSTVDYLVVAAGGGGGGGGGGAGGFRAAATTFTNAGPSSPRTACVSALPVSATAYPITVSSGGAGGDGSPPAGVNGIRGGNSVFSTITSTGGGGATNWNFPGSYSCQPGGSGGGGSTRTVTCGGSGNTPPVSPPQGENGGPVTSGDADTPGGGGGGIMAVGGTGNAGGVASPGGAGGGLPSAFGTSGVNCGSYYYFAGGGGGSGRTPGGAAGAGGLGGGGAGTVPGTCNGVNGIVNTGGGAGGGGYTTPSNTYATGGNGGSGIVIIRYKFQ